MNIQKNVIHETTQKMLEYLADFENFERKEKEFKDWILAIYPYKNHLSNIAIGILNLKQKLWVEKVLFTDKKTREYIDLKTKIEICNIFYNYIIDLIKTI